LLKGAGSNCIKICCRLYNFSVNLFSVTPLITTIPTVIEDFAYGVTWLVTLVGECRQNWPWVLGTSIYEGVDLERRGRLVSTTLTPISCLPVCKLVTKKIFLGWKKYWGHLSPPPSNAYWFCHWAFSCSFIGRCDITSRKLEYAKFGICNRRHELTNSWCLSISDRVCYLNRYLAFYFHTLTTMHGQNHIKFVPCFCHSRHEKTYFSSPYLIYVILAAQSFQLSFRLKS